MTQAEALYSGRGGAAGVFGFSATLRRARDCLAGRRAGRAPGSYIFVRSVPLFHSDLKRGADPACTRTARTRLYSRAAGGAVRRCGTAWRQPSPQGRFEDTCAHLFSPDASPRSDAPVVRLSRPTVLRGSVPCTPSRSPRRAPVASPEPGQARTRAHPRSALRVLFDVL